MHHRTTDATLVLLEELADELDRHRPALEHLARRADKALDGVSWCECCEEQPEASQRLHDGLVALTRSFISATGVLP